MDYRQLISFTGDETGDISVFITAEDTHKIIRNNDIYSKQKDQVQRY